jgi:hypothetical protein
MRVAAIPDTHGILPLEAAGREVRQSGVVGGADVVRGRCQMKPLRV